MYFRGGVLDGKIIFIVLTRFNFIILQRGMSFMKKVILAFSGGLDTSFCVVYLKEKGYDVVTATINTGGFDKDELLKIEQKSKKLGAINHYNIDVQERIYNDIIQYVIKLNGLYEDEYPVMCADRYVISESILEIAKKENTNIIAHGSTAVGNDQIRFDASFLTLNKDVEILTPIKELNINREAEIEYLEKRGYSVDSSVKKYSINENVFGVTASGSEIDKNLEPEYEAYKLSSLKSDKTSEYLSIGFESGLPVSLNGESIKGVELLSKLNKILGEYGYGDCIYTGDCIIGIKGRLLFEAPGLLALVRAHKKLEEMVLTKRQIMFNKLASTNWSDLVYSGLYYEPLVKNIENYIDAVQKDVTGTVKIKAIPNAIKIVEVQSEKSLINEEIAIYAQESSWTGTEANGFIKLHSMQQRLAAKS